MHSEISTATDARPINQKRQTNEDIIMPNFAHVLRLLRGNSSLHKKLTATDV
jgi:hypothetical protein